MEELEQAESQQYPYGCGYCLGWVIWSGERQRYEHATDGERVKADAPGDYASAPHNLAGTPVNPADVLDAEEMEREREYSTSIPNEFPTDSDGFGNAFPEREYPTA